MAAVTRLVTFVDVDGNARDPRQMSVSARHEAVLASGRLVLLLDDRGWTCSAVRAGLELPGEDLDHSETLDVWATTSVDDVVRTARTVVGPDEPFGDRSFEDMAADHWSYLADILRQQGIAADPSQLRRLPHDVVLSDRLLARLRPSPSD